MRILYEEVKDKNNFGNTQKKNIKQDKKKGKKIEPYSSLPYAASDCRGTIQTASYLVSKTS